MKLRKALAVLVALAVGFSPAYVNFGIFAPVSAYAEEVAVLEAELEEDSDSVIDEEEQADQDDLSLDEEDVEVALESDDKAEDPDINMFDTATGPDESEDISFADVELAKEKYNYTGKAIKPGVTVTFDGVELDEDVDYEVSYSNNKKVGTATVTITGIGDFTGSQEVTFKIVAVKVKSVTLNRTSATVLPGKKLTLEATINPSNATDKNITWKSSNEKVAKVNSKGVVTGVAPGKATITATAKDGSKKNATAKITVPGIKLSKTAITVKKGKTATIKATPVSDSIKSVTSGNKKVATVTVKGNKITIKGVKAGTATIKVVSKKGVKSTIKVTVKKTA